MITSNIKPVLEETAERRRQGIARAHEMKRGLIAQYPALAAADKNLRRSLTGDENAAAAAKKAYERALAEAAAQAGVPMEALSYVPACPLCEDTGFRGGEVCACVRNEAARRMAALRQKEITFADFDPSVFPETEVRPGVTQREYMLRLKQVCLKYCADYPHTAYQNIVLEGRSGVGKTFLMKCMQAELAQRGFSTVFVTAYRLNELISRSMVGGADMTPFLDSDVLLLDDLGTEPIFRNVTVNGLFNIFNERLESGKATVVTTNLTSAELRDRYEERIYSRLTDQRFGKVFTLPGQDIRKNRGDKKGE